MHNIPCQVWVHGIWNAISEWPWLWKIKICQSSREVYQHACEGHHSLSPLETTPCSYSEMGYLQVEATIICRSLTYTCILECLSVKSDRHVVYFKTIKYGCGSCHVPFVIEATTVHLQPGPIILYHKMPVPTVSNIHCYCLVQWWYRFTWLFNSFYHFYDNNYWFNIVCSAGINQYQWIFMIRDTIIHYYL